MTLEKLQETAQSLSNELNKYMDGTRTKASSARIRLLLGEIKKNTPDYRRLLMSEDKK